MAVTPERARPPTPAMAPIAPKADPVRAAAIAFADAYAEHLNHHCAKCTQAFEALRAALESPTR